MKQTKKRLEHSLCLSSGLYEDNGLVGPGARDSGGPRFTAADRVLILDTSTPKLGNGSLSIGRMFNRRNRKMWSRAIDGLRLPGRYYFITLTTTPTSPPLKSLWDGLRKWLKAYRPGICWIYCFTMEGKGKGVIHMIVRLGMRQKRVDAKELRAYWKERTGAKQIKIKFVPESKKEDLASYVSNQKTKVGLACEMGYQSSVTRWRWSLGWLPKGYGKSKSKLWAECLTLGAPQNLILKSSNDLLHKMYNEEVKSRS